MGRIRAKARWGALAFACTVAMGTPLLAARADPDAPVSRPWRMSALTIGSAAPSRGLPRPRLNDDNGFVADLRIAAELSDGERRTFRIVGSQQIITERGGLGRVDDGKVYVE